MGVWIKQYSFFVHPAKILFKLQLYFEKLEKYSCQTTKKLGTKVHDSDK